MVRAARDVPGGVRHDLEIVDGAERIPGILMMPNASGSVPAALLLHGFGARKELMADTIGGAFVARGVAALAIDLPMHGGREGSPADLMSANPMRLIGAWRGAVREVRLALEYLGQHERVDEKRLGLVGYSLGSFLANIVAADTSNVRAVVLASSGDLPEGLPFESLLRAVVDPLRAVRRVAGRPLLMVNGRFDRVVRPSQAERLFAQAHEPKMMRWYGGGHWPPQGEIEFAAEWMSMQLGGEDRARRKA